MTDTTTINLPDPPIAPLLPHDDCFIGTALAAKYCDLSQWTMQQLIKSGRGPRAVRLTAKKFGIRVRDLKDWRFPRAYCLHHPPPPPPCAGYTFSRQPLTIADRS
jgi:hypothetical protein